MYSLEFKASVKKDFKNIAKSDILFIKESLYEFVKILTQVMNKS